MGKGSWQMKSPHKRHHRWRTAGIVLLALALLLGVGRALMPRFVRDYVNRTLDRNPLYEGKIRSVQIHLWRGAYSIEDVRISKVTGNVPVPFFAAKRVDFAIQWNALFHRRIVGRVLMEQPEMNFVDDKVEGESQTGAGAPWLEMIRDLFPFKINRALVQNGSIHFRAFTTAKPVDVYLSQLNASIDDLSNIDDKTHPLVATVQAAGLAMDQARFEFKMTLDPFSYRPTFHMALRLLGLDVTKLNDLTLAYGKFDLKRGWFDLVVEADAKEGRMTGYVKPLFRDLKLFDLGEDIKGGNIFQATWQALLATVTTLLKNQPRDQFGTLIPFEGDFSGTTTMNIVATVVNVLRNAFVRAYVPRLEGSEGTVGLEFEAPQFDESLATGGAN
jgi:hypothetical protein